MQAIVRFTAATAVILALSVESGCKTQGTSGIKDALSDNIRDTLPVGIVGKTIDQKDIAKYVVPGDGSNGVPHTMDGIWWTDAHTVHFLASFKNAYWDADKNAASLLFIGPGTYSNKANDSTPAGFLAPADGSKLEGYDIIFSKDGKMAWLCPASTNEDGDREVEAKEKTPYTMEWKSNNHWTRHSKGQADYELRRIINADGTPDPENFPKYLADFNTGVLVYLPAFVLTEKNLSLSIPVTSDTPIYINSNLDGFYKISHDGSVPVTMTASNQKANGVQGTGSGNSLTLNGSTYVNTTTTTIAIAPKKGARGTLTLTAARSTDVPVASLTDPTTATVPADGSPLFVNTSAAGLSQRGAIIYRFNAKADFASSVVLHYGTGGTETLNLTGNDQFLFKLSTGYLSAYLEFRGKGGGGPLTLTATPVPVTFKQNNNITVDAAAVSQTLESVTSVNCYNVSPKLPSGDEYFYKLVTTDPSGIIFSHNKLGDIGPSEHTFKPIAVWNGGLACIQYHGNLNDPAASTNLGYSLQMLNDDPTPGADNS